MKTQFTKRCRRRNSKGYPTDLSQHNLSDPTKELSSLVRHHEGDSFASKYLSEQLLSKYCDESLTPAEVRRSNAINKLKENERINGRTNERLMFDTTWFGLKSFTSDDVKRLARERISQVLSDIDPKSIGLGPNSGGASTSMRRSGFNAQQKYVLGRDSTLPALEVLKSLHWIPSTLEGAIIGSDINVVRGAELFTVPKKTDIDRCAAKEPDINMMLQKGVGNYIRKRLRRFGINLNDQSINRNYAREGSLTGHLATVDLSAASDSVTIQLVLELLPFEWYDYLDRIRSPEVNIDGVWVKTELFSTMGNGFTFELESLIFYGLLSAVSYLTGTKGVKSVYGDDIICPSSMVRTFSHVMGYFGFRFNPDKSFSTGFFRESCGGHYYKGNDVTPFYIRGPIKTIQDYLKCCNQFRKWITIVKPSFSFEKLWLHLTTPIDKRLRGSNDFESIDSLVTIDKPRKRIVEGQFEPKLVHLDSSQLGAYALWLHTSQECSKLSDIPRDPKVTSQLYIGTGKFRLRSQVKSPKGLPHWSKDGLLSWEKVNMIEYLDIDYCT